MMNLFSTSLTKRATTTAFGTCFIPPQNGVVEGSMHYGSGNTSPLMTRPGDIPIGNVAASDPQTRPTVLDVSTLTKTTARHGFLSKTVQNDMGDNDDGSLPCTPEVLSDMDVSSCPDGDEVLDNNTRQLIGAFLIDFTGLSKQRSRKSKELSTMKTVVAELLEKHRYAYNGMIKKLDLDDRGDDVSFVTSVAKSLFSDGTTNWGRIASLVAFGAVVCQYLKEKKRENCVELVGQEISTYLLSEQRDWLVKNNSWDGFVDFFHVADPESTVRNTLMAFAGVAGIGATLALLIR